MGIFWRFSALLLATLALAFPAFGQAGGGAPTAYVYCYSGTVPTSPTSWEPCSATNPLPITVESGGSTPGAGSQPYNYTPLTPMQAGLTVVSSTPLTVPATSLQALVCVSGNNVKYTTDGTTTPTASVGMPLQNGQCIFLSGAAVLSNFRAIQIAATATLDVSYFK